MIRRTVRFSGRVQGVGFRYTAMRLAAGRAVTGFVRNLPDGRVEAVIEGSAAEIDEFVETICNHFEGSIVKVDSAEAPATGEFTDFETRR